MKKIVTVVGARPQFVKAAMVSRAILKHAADNPDSGFCEEIIHTGQHYDENMSDIFFVDMGIPKPAVNLAVGSGKHGETTGAMLAQIERELIDRKADAVLVYGDTNSTLAAALAATKLHIPVVHVEAGLRSFNRRMPEEINRVLTDHISSLLLCPTSTAVENLRSEGITEGVSHVGDVMYDAALNFGELAEQKSDVLKRLSLSTGEYYLATVHRAENTDDPQRLRGIFAAFSALATADIPVILPLHPRTRAVLVSNDLAAEKSSGFETDNPFVRLIAPISFLDMVALEKGAKVILTDSGGVQKEAYFHGVPCVTLRDETEWMETVGAGWNRVCGADRRAICDAVEWAVLGNKIGEYGSGGASEIVVAEMLRLLG